MTHTRTSGEDNRVINKWFDESLNTEWASKPHYMVRAHINGVVAPNNPAPLTEGAVARRWDSAKDRANGIPPKSHKAAPPSDPTLIEIRNILSRMLQIWEAKP